MNTRLSGINSGSSTIARNLLVLPLLFCFTVSNASGDLAVMREQTAAFEKVDTGGGILPLHNFSLAVELKDQIVYLKWIAENEMNTEKFIVQRSEDGSNFKDISSFDPQGPINVLTEYSATDNAQDLLPTVIYYRVKAKDNRNNFAYSNVVPVRISRLTGFKFWPNPFQSSLQLSYNAPTATSIRVEMYDISGRRQLMQHFSLYRGMNQLTIHDVIQLPHGIYQVRITDMMTHEAVFSSVAK